MHFLAQLNMALIPQTKNLGVSLEWRGESDFIIFHAVHADRALLPSEPGQGNVL